MDEKMAWDLYFCGVAGWRYHPGYTRSPETRNSIQECAEQADKMLAERRKRWAGVN